MRSQADTGDIPRFGRRFECRFFSRAGFPGRARGFTLLEMFIVLILLGVLTALAAPGTGRFLDSLNVRKQTSNIMATLRYARLKAVTEGREVRVSLEAMDDAILKLSGAVNKNIACELGPDDVLSMEPPEIIFYPEGYVTPGKLEFSKGEMRRTIILDPLTALPFVE